MGLFFGSSGFGIPIIPVFTCVFLLAIMLLDVYCLCGFWAFALRIVRDGAVCSKADVILIGALSTKYL